MEEISEFYASILLNSKWAQKKIASTLDQREGINSRWLKNRGWGRCVDSGISLGAMAHPLKIDDFFCFVFVLHLSLLWSRESELRMSYSRDKKRNLRNETLLKKRQYRSNCC